MAPTQSLESVFRGYRSARSPLQRFEALRGLGLVRFALLSGAFALLFALVPLGIFWLFEDSPSLARREAMVILGEVGLVLGIAGTIAGGLVWLVGESHGRTRAPRG